MPDLTPEDVKTQLGANGLRPVDDEDLEEITHRINAVREAVQALELPEMDALDPAVGTEEPRS